MNVYRITTERWASHLNGSGHPARWNSKGSFVLYTSSSRALATLENVVHRSGEGWNRIFTCVVLQISKEIEIQNADVSVLPADWSAFKNYHLTQSYGDDWIRSRSTAILRVPSAIIKNEFNYLINPQHPDMSKISIESIEPFDFDQRLYDDGQ